MAFWIGIPVGILAGLYLGRAAVEAYFVIQDLAEMMAAMESWKGVTITVSTDPAHLGDDLANQAGHKHLQGGLFLY